MNPNEHSPVTTKLLITSKPQESKTINPEDGNKLLNLVAQGEEAQAEEMLKTMPELLLYRGDVTDLSKFSFKDITALQYAVWALDRHMWDMILKYLPKKEALAQAEQFETGGWVSQHGVTVSWQATIDALQQYSDNFSIWSSRKRNQFWIEEIGKRQLLYPAHVINEYCRTDRSFVPTPGFQEAKLPRTRQTNEGEWFTAVYKGGRLGEQWAVVRGAWAQARASGSSINMTYIFTFRGIDMEPLSQLLAVRSKERADLIVSLKNQKTMNLH